MAANIVNYYGIGNTARGFVSYYESILSNVEDIYLVKNSPQIIKTSVLKAIVQGYLAKGYEVEIINSCMADEYIEGCIVREVGVAFIDGNPIYGTDLVSVAKENQCIDLSHVIDETLVKNRSGNIKFLMNQMNEEIYKAHETFGEALKLHNKWEEIYIKNMDFNRANDFADKLIDRIIVEKSSSGRSEISHRLLGVCTPEGPKDYIPSLTRNIGKRYLIKGRPGTGKSTILFKLLKAAQKKGYDLEAYHCGFDPNSYDMVIIRELGVAVFDSTPPHEYNGNREADEIIDTYDELVLPETDENHMLTIDSIKEAYMDKVHEAIKHLEQGKKYMLDMEKEYLRCVDRSQIRKLEVGLGNLIEIFIK